MKSWTTVWAAGISVFAVAVIIGHIRAAADDEMNAEIDSTQPGGTVRWNQCSFLEPMVVRLVKRGSAERSIIFRATRKSGMKRKMNE